MDSLSLSTVSTTFHSSSSSNAMSCVHQTCDIQMEGGVRKLMLKNCQLDQAGEVSYQALNAITSAMLNVKGKRVPLVGQSRVPTRRGFRTLAVKIKA